ncbi:MAG: hypothetical protein ABIG93_01295 [archaeon]|nr:hypothetical protein [Nanoarchaeota archaeon]
MSDGPIRVETLVYLGDQDYVAHTSYGICGQGPTIPKAIESAQLVVVNYLATFQENGFDVPVPLLTKSTLITQFQDIWKK